MAPWQLYQPSLNCFSKEPLQSLGLLALVKLYTRFLRTLSSVQFNHSVVSDSATPWTTARLASLTITNSRNPPKPMSVESVMPSNHLIFFRPLLLPSIFPSIRVFSNESVVYIRWPKYWHFSFNFRPSNEHPGLMSFRMDWLDLLLDTYFLDFECFLLFCSLIINILVWLWW